MPRPHRTPGMLGGYRVGVYGVLGIVGKAAAVGSATEGILGNG